MELRPKNKPIESNRFQWATHEERDNALRQIARESGYDPKTRFFTSEILAKNNVPERNDVASAEALRRWMRQHVKYQLEAGEQIVKPELTLSRPELGYDCDDQSVALAAMLVSIGAGSKTRFNYWSPRPGAPAVHVSVGVKGPTGWLNVDPIYNRFTGWTPDGYHLYAGSPVVDGGNQHTLIGLNNSQGKAPRFLFAFGLGILISKLWRRKC